jgi:hypothetical protein
MARRHLWVRGGKKKNFNQGASRARARMRAIEIFKIGVLTCIPSLCCGMPTPTCELRPGLYEQKQRLSQAPDTQERETRQGLVYREYNEFFLALSDSSLKDDQKAFRDCSDSALGDPIASRFVALVRYLHDGRRNPREFVSSFPTKETQLPDFWLLDRIMLENQTDGTMNLPGIPLPDGLVDKFISELSTLVSRDTPVAVERYFFIYGHADGEYAEFMDEPTRLLFEDHPELVLKNWPIIRPYRRRLIGMSEDNPPEFSQKIVQKFQALCERKNDQSCNEITKIFR